MANTLCKAERLNSKILIEKMFAGGSKSFSIFPLRVVYMPDKQQQLAIAFIYLSDELTSSAEIEEKMKILLARISEKLV